jgi:ABC-type branched-subunit amino acid transport system substrate-binding protein
MTKSRAARARRFWSVAAGMLLAVGVGACGSSGGSPAAGGSPAGGQCSNVPSGPVHLANIVPLSGPTAQTGQLLQTEMSIVVSYFNAHDSVCGRKFALANYNDQGDPATSLGIARQIASQGNTVIINDSLSAAQNQIQPYLMQQHVLVVNGNGAYALYNVKQNPTAFSAAPSTAQYAQLMVNWAKAHNENDIWILSDGTSFSVELSADAEADTRTAGLAFIKTITYSPTAIDLTTPLTQAREAGIKTIFPTGFTGLQAMMAGLKQMGWSPTIVGWGGLSVAGITSSQVPAGTVDGCVLSYAPGQPTSTLLTPQNTALLNAMQGKIGLNPSTASVILAYFYLLAIKHAIVTANSLDGTRLAAALSATSSLPTNAPGVDLDWTATPAVHNGFPSSQLKECDLKPGPYDIPDAAS